MFEIIAKFESTKIEAKEESRDLAKVCSRKLLFISFSYHLWGEFLFNFFTNLFDIDRARKVTMWQEFLHFDSTRKGLTSLFGSLLLPTETVIGDCARDLFAKWFMIGIPNVNMLWFNFEGSAWFGWSLQLSTNFTSLELIWIRVRDYTDWLSQKYQEPIR